jgi:hypothetical protein
LILIIAEHGRSKALPALALVIAGTLAEVVAGLPIQRLELAPVYAATRILCAGIGIVAQPMFTRRDLIRCAIAIIIDAVADVLFRSLRIAVCQPTYGTLPGPRAISPFVILKAGRRRPTGNGILSTFTLAFCQNALRSGDPACEQCFFTDIAVGTILVGAASTAAEVSYGAIVEAIRQRSGFGGAISRRLARPALGRVI